ncbi:MAG: flagellar hook-basal body complex protein FliE [Candidatus Brocadiia bacterium]
MDTTPVGPGGPSELPLRGSQTPDGADFGKLMKNYLKEVNALQQEADRAVYDLATGRLDSMHKVVAAVNEADLSFRLMMEIRNKLLEAYKEIMRMQV